MKVQIVVLTAGPSEGKIIPVTVPRFVIGRDPECQLRLASPQISNRHCALLQRHDRVFVRDLDSTNGTFFNDRQLRGEIELFDGDRLRVGPLLFDVRLGEAATDEATPMPARSGTKLTGSFPAPVGAGPKDAARPPAEGEEVPEGSTIADTPALPPAAADKKKPPAKGAADSSVAAKTLLRQYIKKLREE